MLAHCAVGSLQSVAPGTRDLPKLFFDTSWWNPGDLWALLHAVPPCQILQRLVDAKDRIEIGEPTAENEPIAPQLERLYVTLCTAVEPMLRAEPPGRGRELAQTATGNPDGPHEAVIDSVRRLLDRAADQEAPDPRRSQRTPGFGLVVAAAIVARTPDAGVPDEATLGNPAAAAAGRGA